jgi:Flp pilus assembly protein TadB
MARHTTFRASDSDREQVAERLRKAAAEGRLLAEELEQRLGAALRARTYGELDALVDDLPGDRAPAPRNHAPAYLKGSAIALGIVVLVAAVLALAALILTGTIVIGGAWIFLGFWFFGCRRGRRYHRYAGGRWERSAGYAPWR